MAILSNINDLFAVDSTGAIELSGDAGTENWVLISKGAGVAAEWVSVPPIIDTRYVKIAGDTMTGNLTINGSNSLTVGGVITSTDLITGTHFSGSGSGASIFGGSVITKPGSNNLGFIVRNDSNAIIGSLLRTTNTTSTLTASTLVLPGTTAQYVRGDGSLATYSPGTGTVTGSGTTNTVTKFTGTAAIGDGPITFSGNNSTFTGTLIGIDADFQPDADSMLRIRNAGTNAISIFADTGDVLYLGGNNTTGMYLDTSANATFVGSITTTAATSGIYIGSSRIFQSSTGDLAISSIGGDLDITTWLRIRAGDAGAIKFAVSSVHGQTRIGGDSDSNYALRVGANSLPSYFENTVGIGTTDPDGWSLNVAKGYTSGFGKAVKITSGNNAVFVNYDTVQVVQSDVPCLSIIETPSDLTQATEQKLTFAVGDARGIIGLSSTVTNGMSFYVNRATNIPGYQTSGTLALQFLNNGNVGIGTDSPDRLLDVSGTGNVYAKIQSTNSTAAGIELDTNGGSIENWLIQADEGIDGLAIYDLGRTDYRMVINASGSVGINNTSPGLTKFSVHSSTSSEWTAEIKNTASSCYGLAINTLTSAGVYNLACYTHTGTGLFVKNDGKVGIGTTAPTGTLEVQAHNNSWDGGLHLKTSTGSLTCMLHPEVGGNYGLMLNTNFYVAGNIGIGVEPDATHDLKVAGTSYLGATTITSTTNMLLTLNPTAGNYGGILFQYGGVTKGASIYNSGLMVYGGEAGIATRIQAGGGYGLHIDYTNQNVHIGGTSNAGYKLQVTGTAYISGNATFAGTIDCDTMLSVSYSDISTGENRGLRIINTSGTDQQWNITAGITGSENESFCIRDATANVNALTMAISSGNAVFAGSVTAGGDVVAYSDERLKSNIKTLDGSKVLNMRGVSFDKDGKKGSGVIAQELEKIAPELVNNDSEYKSVAYGNITGYLIEAIKELEARVKELENK